MLGRNELCPCGSGLKTKRCHRGQPWKRLIFDSPQAEQKAADERMKELARKVSGNEQFRRILLDVRLDLRREVYAAIRPYVMFHVKPFEDLFPTDG